MARNTPTIHCQPLTLASRISTTLSTTWRQEKQRHQCNLKLSFDIDHTNKTACKAPLRQNTLIQLKLSCTCLFGLRPQESRTVFFPMTVPLKFSMASSALFLSKPVAHHFAKSHATRWASWQAQFMFVPVTKLDKTASFSYRDLHRNNLPKLRERLHEVSFSNISINAANKYLQCDKKDNEQWGVYCC